MENIKLSDLTNIVKKTINKNLSLSYWVIAEVSQISLNASGHCYLELVEKENNQIKAKIRANIWAFTYRKIISWFEQSTGNRLQVGMKILANANVDFHPVFGLSLTINDIDPSYTLGEKAKEKLAIINALQKDGIMDMNKDLELPTVLQNIAVISSNTAAGFEDFQNQLLGNSQGLKFNISHFPSIMQGEKAENSIIQALYAIHDEIDQFDCVAIIRGGGSKIDLDCYDTYNLAAHIAQFPIPVLTGIGHDRDESIADMVAHTSFKTPTAVSAFIIEKSVEFDGMLNYYFQKILESTQQRLSAENLKLTKLSQNIKIYSTDRLHFESNKLRSIGNRISASSSKRIFTKNQEFEAIFEKIKFKTLSRIEREKHKLDMQYKTIALLHPNRIMERGYSITLLNGKVINNNSKINIGDNIETIVKDIKISSKITNTETYGN